MTKKPIPPCGNFPERKCPDRGTAYCHTADCPHGYGEYLVTLERYKGELRAEGDAYSEIMAAEVSRARRLRKGKR